MRFSMKLLSVRQIAISMALVSVAASAAEPTVREIPGPKGQSVVVTTVYAPSPVPADKAGLIVHLYGSGGSHKDYNAGGPSYDKFRQIVAERGYWLVVPDLGGKHWMNDAACDQVDAVIAEMVQSEKVDPARVQLLGTSMGGGSSLIYVMRRPKKIKSVVSVFPMSDFTRWLDEAPGYRGRVESAHGVTDANRKEMLEKISPLQHPDAFRDTPIYLLHGAKDGTVKPHHSRDFAAALKEKGCPVTYREVPDEIHRDEIAQPHQQELADFLTKPDK